MKKEQIKYYINQRIEDCETMELEKYGLIETGLDVFVKGKASAFREIMDFMNSIETKNDHK